MDHPAGASTSPEAQAIMQVIEAETAAFWNKDYAAWAACWLPVPAIRMMGWWARGGINITEGWDALSGNIKRLMAENPEPNPTAAQVRRANINLRVSAGMAWVTFDQYGLDTGEPDMDMPGLSHETRVLELHDGAWKLVYASWLLRDQ